MRPVSTMRGLLIVVVGTPLFCQFLFLTVLCVLLLNLEKETEKESHSVELVNEIAAASKEVSQAFFGFQSTDADRQKDVRDRVQVGRQRWERVFDTARHDAHQKENLDEIKSILDNFEKLFLESQGTDRFDRKRRNYLDERLFEQIDHFLDVTEKIARLEIQRSASSPASSKELKNSIRVVFAIALAVSIIGAVVLSWIFANSVSRPLIHLTENSRLLSRREPLLPPLSTGEQFAKLDQDLYMVADAIETAMLREKELIEEAADLICALDADGAIKSVNSYARALLGLSTDELIGRSILELVYVEDCVSLDQKFKDARQALSKTDFECRLVDSAGRIIDTRWYAFWSPVETALFCVVHDIREEKKLERLKEDYLNMVSHDLRSPLMSMQASMDLIAAGGKGVVAPAVKSEVEEAARSIERLTALVNDLLDFQKLRAGKIQLDLVSFDLKDLLAEACEMVNALARKKGVSIKLPETSATVRADRSKLRQSLVNLLSNAVKFSPDNQEVVVSVLLADDSFEIRVADKGPGVPGEYQEKIFEAFEQVPAAASGSIGSGLGLAIHKMIVLAHGGSLGVQSDGSSYSVFWFNIPKIPA